MSVLLCCLERFIFCKLLYCTTPINLKVNISITIEKYGVTPVNLSSCKEEMINISAVLRVNVDGGELHKTFFDSNLCWLKTLWVKRKGERNARTWGNHYSGHRSFKKVTIQFWTRMNAILHLRVFDKKYRNEQMILCKPSNGKLKLSLKGSWCLLAGLQMNSTKLWSCRRNGPTIQSLTQTQI